MAEFPFVMANHGTDYDKSVAWDGPIVQCEDVKGCSNQKP